MPINSSRLSPTLIISGIAGFIAFGLIIFFLARAFSAYYSSSKNVDTPVRQIVDQTQAFSVKQVTLKDNKTGCRLEIYKNGYVAQICDDSGRIQARKLFSRQKLLEFFSRLENQADLDALLDHYFSSEFDLEIIIETTQGTKTIIVNDQGETSLDDIVSDIIDDANDLEDEITTPTPPPPSPPAPTPTPPPGSTPLPSPTPPGPTPIPSPISQTEPFDCSMLEQTGVTVSNIRCLDPE